MHTTSGPPRHVTIKRNTFLTLLAAAALVVVALLVALLLLTGSHNPYPVRQPMIPGVQHNVMQNPQAMRYDLSSAQQAQAYFARLLDSEYIGLRGDNTLAPQKIETTWIMKEENGDGTSLSAVFDHEGVIRFLEITTHRSSPMHAAQPQYTLDSGDESLFNYLRAFAYEYLPDVAITSGSIARDEYNGEGRFITVEADSQYAKGAFRFVVQIDPLVRVVGFELLTDPKKALIRTSRIAVAADDTSAVNPTPLPQPLNADTAAQLARTKLADAYSLTAATVEQYILVDVIRYETLPSTLVGTAYSGAYWVVFFRMPETPEDFYSDYSVFLDEGTGNVLQILNPTTITNG